MSGTINLSKTFINVGVRLMGRKSPGERGLSFLGTGVIVARFQTEGTWELFNEQLNIYANGVANSIENSLIKLAGN